MIEKAQAIQLFHSVCNEIPIEKRLENFKWQWEKNILQVHNDSIVVRVDSISGQPARILVSQLSKKSIESERPVIFDITSEEYAAIASIYNKI